MNKFFAICPFCNRSIYVEENLSGGYSCPQCGQGLGLPFLMQNNLIINIEAAQAEFSIAQDYFMNTDFREAQTHYKKVLIYDKNNYLSEYYYRLCEIYEQELNKDYDISSALINAVNQSIKKLTLAKSTISNKIDFLFSIFTQSHIILKNRFNAIVSAYQDKQDWNSLREKCLSMLGNMKGFILINKEVLMIYDKNITNALKDICALAIEISYKIITPHLVGKYLDIPTDYEYKTTKEYFNSFLYFAISIIPGYEYGGTKLDFSENLLFNQKVTAIANKYHNINKSNKKKFLSTKNNDLSEMVNDCYVAIKYSYNSCFKGLLPQKSEQARIALINESIRYSFEYLMPRVFATPDKKVNIEIKKFSKVSEISVYLNAFIADFNDYNKRITAEYVNRFYDEVYEMTKLYYSLLYNSHNNLINKMKETQSAEFVYYKNFLYKITNCCALALKSVLEFDLIKNNSRKKLLKLGKEVAEEFLLLSDYNIEEIEQSALYGDIIDIYNYIDDEINTQK